MLALLAGTTMPLFAQGTAFTYQGRLNSGGSPASGLYDFRFKVYADPLGNTQVGSAYLTNGIPATNGLFITTVDFGAAMFTGGTNWLEIDVRTNGAAGYTVLNPLQDITPTPYAISAESVSGGISASQLNGGIIPNTVIAGFQGPSYAVVNGGFGNAATGTYDVVGGGQFNTVNNFAGVVAGGYGNTAGYQASVGGGQENLASGQQATIPGGNNNLASGNFSFAAGDMAQAVNQGAFVWSDSQGTAFSSMTNNSFNVRAGGGARFLTSGKGMTLDGAPVLTISSAPLGITLQQNTNGGPNVIEGSASNSIAPGVTGSVIGGGGATNYNGLGVYPNIIAGGSDFSIIGGGDFNLIYNNSTNSVISGGGYNAVTSGSPFSSIGGGYNNIVGGQYSTVPGGFENEAVGVASFAAGYGAQTTWGGTFIWADAEGSLFTAGGPNQFLIRASGGVGVGTASPQASVDIVSGNGIADPQLRLQQQSGIDFARLRYQSGTSPYWDVSAGGTSDQMNWYVPNYGNVMMLQTNGALTTGGLTVNNNGAIHVSGAGQNTKTAAFVQVATVANTTEEPVEIFTVIDNPLCNGNSNAILTITHRFASPPGLENHVVSATYGFGPSSNQWAIENEDDANMDVGAEFNVLVVLP